MMGRNKFRRNMTCFPSKRKDGVCRISTCPQYGNYMKRLDNHLSVFHKGTTRAMNDSLPHPGAYKSAYLENLRQGKTNYVIANLGKSKDLSDGKISARKSSVPSTSSVASTSSSSTHKKCIVKRRLFSKQSTSTKQKFVKRGNFELKFRSKIATASEDQMNQNSSDQLVSLESSNNFIGEWCAHTLRFLIHNTYSFKLGSLLSFIRENQSLEDYHKTKLCKDVFGEVPLDFLKALNYHRRPLNSYFQRLRCLPNISQKTVDLCMACETTGGKCVCPELDTAFFIFCRKPCLKERFDCKKCSNWAIHTHVCFDFFSCTVCDKYYSSTKPNCGKYYV